MLLRLAVSPSDPDRMLLERAAESIRRGGVVGVPTDTLYGLAADPFSTDAVRRVFEIKGRSAERALPLMASGIEQVSTSLGRLTPTAERLAECFWPGPLTVLIAAVDTLAPELTGGTGRVGVRVPSHPVARLLCELCERPLTATSANLSGEPATDDPESVLRSLGDRLDMLIDAGRTRGGSPSTIVDATGASVQLIRAGDIPWEEIEACLRHA
jgi:L-threonylcarbamoyladenylate synthase